MADNVWEKIKAEYLAGGVSQRILAEKYKVSPSALKRVAAKENWRALRDKTRRKADEKITSAISKKQARRAERLTDAADKLLVKLEGMIDDLTADEIQLDRYAIKQITGGMRDIMTIFGVKSPLDTEEQKARIKKLKKEASEEKTDNKLTVVFGSDAEEFAD